jgi:hypothetical protein
MKIIIIGAGIIGRFAKVLMSEAVIFDSKNKGDKITSDILGANLSRQIAPELDCSEGILETKIDGKTPTKESILKYRMNKFSTTEIEFGDYKQFSPIQRVYFVKKPDIDDINYGCQVKNINAIDKIIDVYHIDTKTTESISYDCIISTIPLKNLIQIIDITKNSPFIKAVINKFINKIIYHKEIVGDCISGNDTFIFDYLTSDESVINRKSYLKNRIGYESFYMFEGAKKIYPGKIMGSDFTEEIAKDLQLYSIYCYGRFARWRHKEMLHETFKNLRRFCERKGQIGYS